MTYMILMTQFTTNSVKKLILKLAALIMTRGRDDTADNF